MVDKDLTSVPSELEGSDGGRIGQAVGGIAVYHAPSAGEDYALVSSDGRLFLYRVKPTFAFVQELTIDGATAGP